jgi:hypothetical protein
VIESVVFQDVGELARVRILIMPTVGKAAEKLIQQTLDCSVVGTIE